MTKVELSQPIKVKLEDGREIEQGYLEFSRITPEDARKYLSGSFISKTTEYRDIAGEIRADFSDDDLENEERMTVFFIKLRKEFFKIFDADDLTRMVAALSKMPIKTIEQLDLFDDLYEMIGDIQPFLLRSQTTDGKK